MQPKLSLTTEVMNGKVDSSLQSVQRIVGQDKPMLGKRFRFAPYDCMPVDAPAHQFDYSSMFLTCTFGKADSVN